MTYDFIKESVEKCANCQKNRRRMTVYLEPIVRHIKVPYLRKRIGMYNLTITPREKYGNDHLLVIVVEYPKFVWGYPAAKFDEETCASAIMIFISLYGLFEEIWSDPGSDFTSNVIKQLNKYLGMNHVFSLVDRHESCGVEGSNKQILRHVKALVMDQRSESTWSEPVDLALTFFVINDEINSETGCRPMDAMFGSSDGPYLTLPEGILPKEITEKWIKHLDAKLQTIRAISREHQVKIIDSRTKVTPIAEQNIYNPGELVLWQRDPTKPLPNKLASNFKGPYEVMTHDRNDVTCRHIVLKNVEIFPVNRLKMFHGTRDDGYRAAMYDANQANIIKIHAWRNTAEERSFMDFLIEFENRKPEWTPYSQDLDASVPYGEYVTREKPLFLLRFKKIIADKQRSELNRRVITDIQPQVRVYVDLRRWSEAWYDQMELPNAYFTTHVVEVVYTRWQGNQQKKIFAKCLLWNEEMPWNHYEVYCYGTQRTLTADMTLIDENFAKVNRQCIPEELQAEVFQRIA